jgi:hypothetical protein
MLCVVAQTMLLLVTSAVFGQQAQIPKQNPFLTYAPTVATANTPASALPGGSHQMLPLFTYTVTSSRDGNTYTGTIVGPDPFAHPGGSARVPTQIVPVIVTTNSVFAGVDSGGNILTKPGVTIFDPTVADDSCSSPPFDVPLTMVQQSPIVRPADFNYGGTDLGFAQTTTAFQRGSFFQRIARGGDDGISYRVVLDPVTTLPAVQINLPADSGVAYPTAAFGGCPTGNEAIIDLAVFEPALVNILPTLASQGVNPGTFPIFLVHNTVECEGTGCATFSPNTACCVLGFHSSVNGAQTFSPSDYDTSNIFLSPVPDVSIMSHEVGEWMNDPFGHNPVPKWGHIGQQPGCQGNLEVGDPLSGTLAPPIAMPNGFTYHMQELAFFSWFYGAPSIGVNGWFSNNATFLHDAGPACQ